MIVYLCCYFSDRALFRIPARKKVLSKILDFAGQCSLVPQKLTNAPIIEGKNMEYVVLLEKNATTSVPIEKLIKSVKL